MAKILVVEDDLNISQGIRDWLVMDQHIVEEAVSGKDALQLLEFYKYDVIILDRGLPEMDGIEVCRRFREMGGLTPILMLTARKATSEKREGLDSGADDYLTKPFEPEELSARVRALLRRPVTIHVGPMKAGNISLDPVSRVASRDCQNLNLSPKEFFLLEFLMKHPNRVFSGDELFSHLWDSQTETSPDMVRTIIKKLRRKIDEEGCSSIIQTVHGQGYKLVLP